MDLGCLDLGCIEKQSKEAFLDSENSLNESVLNTSKAGKNKALKEASQSNVSALNKFTSQIKKPTYRKSSPLNWFPRKKVDSYLKRKIKLLQEVGGMSSTLDETLGDSNLHYSRVSREKIAVREAANKAMEARKAAMVEASWCRILQAARIERNEAEALLLEAEKGAAEAFEAATAIGVTMYDIPDCPRKHYEIETSSVNGGGSTIHTVSTSFETAFDVDKQVAAAVKTAFIRLASCPTINKDEFKELLRRVSQNPDNDESNQEVSELSSECESDTGSELESGPQKEGFCSQNLNCSREVVEVRQRRKHKRQESGNFSMKNLVNMMLERLKCLHEDELASLATIVATRGLNAALAEAENSKLLESDSDFTSAPALDFPRRMSSFGAGTANNSNVDGQMRKKQVEAELPSLDKFLVKRLTRLEREVQEAKNARNNEAREGSEKNSEKSDDEKLCSVDNKPETDKSDLGSILLKRTSKFEKDIEVAKHSSKLERVRNGAIGHTKQDIAEVPSLDKFLVKHVSKLEREVQEAKNSRKFEPIGGDKVTYLSKNAASITSKEESSSCSGGDRVGKENIDLNNQNTSDVLGESPIGQSILETMPGALSIQDENGEGKEAEDSLEKILVKPVHMERVKMEATSLRTNYGTKLNRKKHGGNDTDCEGLDKVLVKHVSRLEKEKMGLGPKEELVMKVKRRETNSQVSSEGSLDQILVKHKSRLEREKIAAAQQPNNQIKHSVARREARDRELQEAWGGLGLGNLDSQVERSEGSLDQILVKHKSRLEREKMAAAQQPDNLIKHSAARREARDRELQEAWGGLSLGNSVRPHVSRLERDKAAWAKAEEEEKKRATEDL